MTVEVVTIGNADLILGNCRDILPDITGVDCFVTDPAYMLASGGRGRAEPGQMTGVFSADRYSNDGNIANWDMPWNELMKLCYAAAADDTQHYFMANAIEIFEARNAAVQAGFKVHNLLYWNKGTATPSRWYMRNTEYSLFLYKGAAKTINNPGATQRFNYPNPTTKHHPTEKPVALMAHYIHNSTRPGDLVVDPQMGSGTTGVAALQEGRRFIGIEKNPEMFKVARTLITAREQHQVWSA